MHNISYEYMKSHCVIHYRWVNCMVCKLKLKKTYEKKKRKEDGWLGPGRGQDQ